MKIRTLTLATCILVLIGLSTALYRNISSTQESSSDEFLITVTPITPITPDTTPDNWKYEAACRITKFYLNPYDGNLQLDIEKGLFYWSLSGYEMQNITFIDNLGNTYNPIIEGDIVKNPPITVVVPPNYRYALSLLFASYSGLSWETTHGYFVLESKFTPSKSINLIVRFPLNFSIFYCTLGANITENEECYQLSWLIEPDKLFELFVDFLPFRLEGTIRSYRFLVDIPSVYPAKSSITGSIEFVFETAKTFSIWKIDPYFVCPIVFPGFADEIAVENVWDGKGNCLRISNPVQNLSNDSLGCYYVSHEQKEVIVYPRYHYNGEFYEYRVGASFIIPPEFTPFQARAIKERFLPYEYESYLIIEKISISSGWRLNITNELEIKFILPSNTRPIISKSYPSEASQRFEDGRPTIYWIYQSPKTISPGKYTAVYEVVPLKDSFSFGILLLILLVLFGFVGIVLDFKFKHKRKRSENLLLAIGPLSIPLAFITYTAYILGPSIALSNLVLLLILTIQVILSIFFLGYRFFFRWARRISQRLGMHS